MIVYVHNGTTYVQIFAISESVNVEDRVLERSVARFTERFSSYMTRPKGTRVRITDENNALLFVGFVETSEVNFAERIDPEDPDYSAVICNSTCVDLHYCADKRIIARSYIDTTAGDIVRDIITNSAVPPYIGEEGILVGDIHTGSLMTEVVFNYVPVSRALDRLCEANDYYWRIRPNGQLDFRPREVEPANFILTSNHIEDEGTKVVYGNPFYRNRQYMRGIKDLTDEQIEHKKGDGATRTWEVAYPINQEPVIYLNSVLMDAATEVGIRGVENGPTFKFFWNKGDRVISHSDDFTVLTAADNIEIRYIGEFDIILLTYNQAEIDLMQDLEGTTSGKVDHVELAQDVSGRTSGTLLANGLLATYGRSGRVFTFETFTHGLEAGQLLTVNVPEMNLINVDMLIESVTERDY